MVLGACWSEAAARAMQVGRLLVSLPPRKRRIPVNGRAEGARDAGRNVGRWSYKSRRPRGSAASTADRSPRASPDARLERRTVTDYSPPEQAVTTPATAQLSAEMAQPTGRAMGSHHSHRAGTTTWLTPPHIIKALGPFDLDPCAAPAWPTASEHYILPTDGLAQPWRGMVWLNPPYGSEAWTWLDRLAEHGSGIALIFARTETAGFVEQVWSKADAVLFLHGRLHFHYPDGTRAAANSGAPSCLVAYGAEAVERLEKSGLAGSLVSAWRPARGAQAGLDFGGVA